MSLRSIQAALYTTVAAAWLLLTRVPMHGGASRTLMVMPHTHQARLMAMDHTMTMTGHLTARLGLEVAVMTLAMMLPAAVPAASFVAASTLKTRRAHSVLLFLGSYFTVWLAFLTVALAVIRVLQPSATAAAIGIGVIAAAWQLSPTKRAALRACHSATRLPVLGWRALVGCLEFGARHAIACISSCWALMLIPLPGHTVAAMVPVTGYLWIERHRRPTRTLLLASAISIVGIIAVAAAA